MYFRRLSKSTKPANKGSDNNETEMSRCVVCMLICFNYSALYTRHNNGTTLSEQKPKKKFKIDGIVPGKLNETKIKVVHFLNYTFPTGF